jgi:putative PEP-CTERM system histidine kinase
LLAVGLAAAVFFHERRSLSRWCFCGGMVLLAIEAIFGTISLRADSAAELQRWQTFAWMTKAFVAGPWLCFSLVYSRGNYGEFLSRWKVALICASAAPAAVALVFHDSLLRIVVPEEAGGAVWLALGSPGKVLNIVLLLIAVAILTNLEKTFRSAVGTMQWRIKFLILGLGVIFGVRIYTRTQGLLYSGVDLRSSIMESVALLIGCGLIGISYLRSGFAGVEVYPSRAVLQRSVTILLVGGYLFILGVLAQLTAFFGGAATFQIQSLLVLLGIVFLAIMLLSRRIRQAINRTVTRHFKRPEHDAYSVWTELTRSLARQRSRHGLCGAAGKLLSETFSALSVTIWLADEKTEALDVAYSTARPGSGEAGNAASSQTSRIPPAPSEYTTPFDLEAATGEWAARLREINASLFHHGGKRVCVPLTSGDRGLGVIILGDRVNGTPYTPEEMDLLKCIGDQIAAGLLNFRLAEELLAAKELEALQAISTFFVHDLKNATSGLNLILKNLPVHFDDPEFRADALRAVGNTINRIGSLTERLGILRDKIELKLAKCDLNQLVSDAIASLNGMPDIVLEKELRAVPLIMADQEQLHTVVTNLLLNARDAVGQGGRVRVESLAQNGKATIIVADHGCGMSTAFLRNSLFRPFSTTKKKGMGIGMFQSRMIVEAHRGTLVAESTEGVGSTFRVTLPLDSNQ